ncbi:MAG: hypothetical protein DDT30_01151 [Dehalococcoidia bacterium]|nr:hypothetical protein [Bacillota bacterium]MBT9142704.1 hypothetical protein [Bacillota bacterium]
MPMLSPPTLLYDRDEPVVRKNYSGASEAATRKSSAVGSEPLRIKSLCPSKRSDGALTISSG